MEETLKKGGSLKQKKIKEVEEALIRSFEGHNDD